MSVYDRADTARLPKIGKQTKLTDRVFLITGLERCEGQADADREARDYYIADVLVDGDEGKFYLAGTAVVPVLDLIAADAEGLPSAWRQVQKRTRTGGKMYDLVEPEASDIKRLMAQHRKLTVVEMAS